MRDEVWYGVLVLRTKLIAPTVKLVIFYCSVVLFWWEKSRVTFGNHLPRSPVAITLAELERVLVFKFVVVLQPPLLLPRSYGTGCTFRTRCDMLVPFEFAN